MLLNKLMSINEINDPTHNAYPIHQYPKFPNQFRLGDRLSGNVHINKKALLQ